MGKKLKTGKGRRDKFYHLAKETGYRSRSAFKLIQLNRRFQFLQKARVLVDLCAAPGGWLQVASTSMPVSSLIIGVDLVPIKSIPNVVSIQEDITTDRCRQALSRELHSWKADVFLNDGAPNVGSSWSHDAFSQAHLTLMALRLASEFLARGGTFVSKVFRSQDYQPLLWVLNQLFCKVQATKPQASRTESAEIFLVCQGYNAPDKIDRKFFDPKHVFKQVETQVRTVHDLVSSKKPKADGYTDGDYTLFHCISLLDFLKCPNPINTLHKASEITFDCPQMENHPATTQEIRECCKDLQVLGRKELGVLLKWRRRLRMSLGRELHGGAGGAEPPLRASEDEEEGRGAEAVTEQEERHLDEELAEVKAGELAELRRKKKKILKACRRQRERAQLGMDLPGISVADDVDATLFSIAPLGGTKMKEMQKGDMAEADRVLVEGGGDPEGLHLSDAELSDVPSMESEADKVEDRPRRIPCRRRREEDVPREEAADNPLLVHLEPVDQRLEKTTSLWFSKDGFSGMDMDQDLSLEIEQTEKLCRHQAARQRTEIREATTTQLEEGSNGDSSSNKRVILDSKSQVQKHASLELNGGFFDIIPVKKCVRVLDAEDLALGTVIATSKKKERDLVDYTFNRYTFTEPEEQLPDWFVDNELRFCKRPPPFDPAMAREFRQRWKEINARPIKKIAEAKARKKRRMMKRMEDLRKKADAVVNTVDISEKEKMAQMRSLYKKAHLGREKREVTYVVSHRGSGARMGRPPGVKGRYRRVDARMKKDNQKTGQGRRGKGQGHR